MYALEPAWLDSALPVQEMQLDWESGALQVRDELEHMVVPRLDRRFRPAGTRIAGTQLLDLMQVTQPLRAQWALRGTDQDGWSTAGQPVTLRLFGDQVSPRVKLAVQLTSTVHVTGPRAYRITGGGSLVRGVVLQNTTKIARLSACTGAGPTDITITVRGSSELPGGRQVGLAVTGVSAVPAGACPARPG
jgi:hypothetical protein